MNTVEFDPERDAYWHHPIDDIEPEETNIGREECLEDLRLMNILFQWALAGDEKGTIDERLWSAGWFLGLPISRRFDTFTKMCRSNKFSLARCNRFLAQFSEMYFRVLDRDAVRCEGATKAILNQAVRFVANAAASHIALHACAYALGLEICGGKSMTKTTDRYQESKGSLSAKMLDFHSIIKNLYPNLPDSPYQKNPETQKIYREKRIEFCKSNETK